MQTLKSTGCTLLLLLILSGCTSKPSVPCLKSPSPPAWMMQPPPDLQTPLSEIIGYSDSELPPQNK
ncbi:membrane protein [Xenorhabdus sp. GDc328]|nr:membrane protein [Xenorhabdus griffiniae]KOP31919.1 membrane protein [Xenorhabdus sp. GDc328]